MGSLSDGAGAAAEAQMMDGSRGSSSTDEFAELFRSDPDFREALYNNSEYMDRPQEESCCSDAEMEGEGDEENAGKEGEEAEASEEEPRATARSDAGRSGHCDAGDERRGC
jgi:hypothetical protein